MTLLYDDVIRPIAFHNTSGKEVPGFALMAIDGFDSNGLFEVIQPLEITPPHLIVFNDRVPIPIDGYGEAFATPPCRVLFQGAAPSIGDRVGYIDGWEAVPSGFGPFPVWGIYDTDSIVIGPRITGTVCGRIRFEIIVVYSSVATVDIKSRDCGCSEVPEEDVNGEVDVHDPSLCYFDEPDVDLIGRPGWAAYQEYEPDECRWEVYNLCCP